MAIVELSTRECGGRAVVSVRGELDVAGAAGVAASLAQIAACGFPVIVDLAGLEFIDSSGLAALLYARRHARRAGGDVLLAAPQQQVLRLLALTRLAEVFPVHACVQDAAGSPSGPLAATAPAPAAPVILAATSTAA